MIRTRLERELDERCRDDETGDPRVLSTISYYLSALQGATIRRDEATGVVIVARIMRGGAADRSGKLFFLLSHNRDSYYHECYRGNAGVCVHSTLHTHALYEYDCSMSAMCAPRPERKAVGSLILY